MECAACHGGGARGFASDIPEGRYFWNEEESLANYGIIMEYGRAGVSTPKPVSDLLFSTHMRVGTTTIVAGGVGGIRGRS